MSATVRTRALLPALALVAPLALAGCNEPADNPVSEPEGATAPADVDSTPAVVEGRTDECLSVDDDVAGHVISGEDPGAGLEATIAAAVETDGPGPAYLVAVRFDADGIDTQRGVWAMDDITDDTADVWTVDQAAAEATQWPAISTTDSDVGPDDELVDLALGCLAIE